MSGTEDKARKEKGGEWGHGMGWVQLVAIQVLIVGSGHPSRLFFPYSQPWVSVGEEMVPTFEERNKYVHGGCERESSALEEKVEQ